MPIDPSIPLQVQPIDVAGDVARRRTMQQQVEMNALKLQEAKKAASQSPMNEEAFMQQVVQEAGGDPAKVGEVLLRRGRLKEAIEFIQGWDAHLKAQQGTTAAPKITQIQTVDEQGNPVTKFVEETAGASYPMIPKPVAGESGFTLGEGQQRFGPDGKLIASVPKPRPVGGGSEPLIAIMGPDGKPVLVPRSQAAGKQPASNREQGRNVTSGDANRITDFDTSLNDVKTLRSTVSGAGSTGVLPSIGAALPNWATNMTGVGVGAKERQAVIDRVKQVIGKALEGGVLRKEDEYKYTKILPTISDHPQVVATKLDGLEAAIRQKKQTLLDNLADANYDTSRFESRTAAPAANAPKNPFRK